MNARLVLRYVTAIGLVFFGLVLMHPVAPWYRTLLGSFLLAGGVIARYEMKP